MLYILPVKLKHIYALFLDLWNNLCPDINQGFLRFQIEKNSVKLYLLTFSSCQSAYTNFNIVNNLDKKIFVFKFVKI